MKKIGLYSILLLLSACQPVQQSRQQQQNLVCKSLIEGYLKVQRLTQFELQTTQFQKMNASTQINYVYRQPTGGSIMQGLPRLTEIRFQCQLVGTAHYRLQWLDSNSAAMTLLSMYLPPNRFINTSPASVRETR